MRWLNEPSVWSGDASDLTVALEPETDFWRTTHLVVTNGVSDWSQQPAPPPADGWYDIRAVREGDSVQILCGDQAGEVSSGPMCAAPKGPGFTARFLNGDSPL